MNSQTEQSSLVVTRRLADRTVEWIPLEIPQHLPAAPGAAYALIDRSDFEAPQPLLARRQGEDLVVEVNETEVLVLDGFFATNDVAFYPTPDIAGGAGPFSGSPLTPESQVLAASPEGEQVVWSAEPAGGEEVVRSAEDGGGDGGSPLLWGGLAAGGLGLALAAGGGGGGGGDGGTGGGDGGTGGGDGGADPDDSAPSITSDSTAPAIDENSGSGQAVYTAMATDDGPVTWSLEDSGDAADFSIEADTGVVTLTVDPDHETQSSYDFTVVATDDAGNSSEQTVSLAINDLDEVAPTITSGATAPAIDENSSAGQVVYTVTSTDDGDVSTGSTTYSLAPVDDAADFSIDADTGAVTLTVNPDFETQSSYSFTVVATDAAGNSSQQAVSLAINDQDDFAPHITSGATASAIDENNGADQVVYTATATDDGPVTWSLEDSGDAADFSIDANTGAVTLNEDPDHETQPSYDFTVVATDAEDNSSAQAVSLTINDLDEVAPTITSGATAPAIDENSGAGQVVYTATADDSADISDGVTFSLAGDDAADFSIDAGAGDVTLTEDPDFETQSSYDFTVVATDDAGNSSQQAVSLAINDQDDSAPSITSGATASAIDENSGADQVVYNATATDDGTVTWSLENSGDAADFSINASTGAVTLTEDPDHETQPSYDFTVVATDDADNSSQQAVSLAINDLDEVAPTITSGATAPAIDENSGSGQVVYTVTSTDDGDVSTGSTTYSLAPVDDAADFSIDAGTGEVTLTEDPDFETQSSYDFTVVATDDAGNSSQQAVSLAINDVDDTPPTLSSSTPADDATGVPVDADIVLTFSEDVLVGSGNVTISDGAGDTRTIDATDGSQVSVSGNQATINPAADLNADSTYNVQIDDGAFTDEAGNAYGGISNSTALDFATESGVDTSVVAFDLVQGSSSDHSGRTFQSDVSYDVYIRVDSDAATLSTAGGGPGTWGAWSGAANLGSDDRIILVGSNAEVQGSGGVVESFTTTVGGAFWNTATASAAVMQQNGLFTRFTGLTGNATLWAGTWNTNPDGGSTLNQVYLTAMPPNVLTSQGLA